MSLTTGDIIKLVAVLVFDDGNILQNVFSTVITGAGGPWDDDDVADDLSTWVYDLLVLLGSYMVDDIQGSEVRGYVYDAIDDDFDEFGSSALAFTPTNTDDCLPRGVSALVNCKTTDPDVNGKKYFGGLGENAHDDSVWASAFITQLALAAAEWVTPFVGAISGADFTPGVWSPTRTIFYPMSATVVIPTIAAYQRRRKQGVGI